MFYPGLLVSDVYKLTGSSYFIIIIMRNFLKWPK